jgi:hypothetical protein
VGGTAQRAHGTLQGYKQAEGWQSDVAAAEPSSPEVS